MNLNIKRIDHIQICVPREDEILAKEFYTSVLGLKEIEKPEALKGRGGFWLEAGDIQIHIGVVDNFKKPQKQHPAFVVSGLEELEIWFDKNNVPIKKDVALPNYNRYSIFDPFGNRIELLEEI